MPTTTTSEPVLQPASGSRVTVKSAPPPERLVSRQRRSYWPVVFEEARECPGEWVRTARWFHKATPQQLASDLRNAHRRSSKTRVSGHRPGDLWETRWGNDPSDPDAGHFYIWLRFDGAPAH